MRQRVEIVKALMGGRPICWCSTSDLDPRRGSRGLIGVMRKLRPTGARFIFISHKLGEVLSVCDDVVVLRDGRVGGTHTRRRHDARKLAHMMVGRTLAEPPRRATRHPGASAVRAGVSANDSSGLRACRTEFSLRGGEILALAGSTATARRSWCDHAERA